MKRKYTALFLACMMLFSISGFSGMGMVSHAITAEGFEGGTGTAEDPWQIATAAQLNNVRNYLGTDNSDKYFMLVDNIDLNVSPYNEGAGWVPIGTEGNPFTGNFDGKGLTIDGLYIYDTSRWDIGLFGDLWGGTIQNVKLTNVDVTGDDYVGGLVGYCFGPTGNINHVSVTGSVSGIEFVGGLIGDNSGGVVENAWAEVQITGDNYLGALAGINMLTVHNSWAVGQISGGEFLGGLIGINWGTVANTWAAVQVTGINYLGGLIGENNSSVLDSYYNYEVAVLSDTGKGEPRSTEDMTYPYNETNTYIDWDFDNVWDIQDGVNSGYPFIRQQQPEPPGEFGGGDGSEEKPFQIATAAHLNNVRNYLGSTHTDKHFLLMNDIDLTSYVSSGGDGYNDGKGWLPIGYSPPENPYNYTNAFYGSFDGGGHTISGLFINRQPADFYDYEPCGLFGAVADAELSDLTLTGQVTGNQMAGGLVGYAVRTTMNDISFSGNVTDNANYAGGLVGLAKESSLTDCTTAGTVSTTSGSAYTGGVVGMGNDIIMTNCHSSASVSGTHSAGGLAGYIDGGASIITSNATGNVTGTSSEIGGLLGVLENSSVSQSFASGDVSGSHRVGGLCGINNGSTITNSYATGGVTGTNEVGGLVGYNGSGSLTNTYAVGYVNSTGASTGGLVGEFSVSSPVYTSFYDTETTGQSTDNSIYDLKGIPKTTAEMMQELTFTGWDFVNVWGIEENVTYPYLLTEPVVPVTHTVTYSVVGGNGTLGASVEGTAIASGDPVVAGKDVLFTATPDSGYRVKEWTINSVIVADNKTNTLTIESLAQDVTVTVEFELIPPVTHTVTYSVVGGNGTLGASVEGTAIASGDPVVEGKDVLFTATPDSGYRVKEWTINSAIVADNKTDTLTIESLAQDITVTVEFELIPPVTHTVTYSVVGGNGTLGASVEGTAITSGDPVVEGKDVLFTATPDSGYRVKEWTINSAIVVDNKTDTLTFESLAQDITVTVEFELIPPVTHTVTYSVVGGNGTLGASVEGTGIASGDPVVEGKDVLFTATPNSGYRVKEWTINSAIVADNTTNTFTVESIGQDTTVTVEFELIPPVTHTVTYSVVGGNGTLGASVEGTAIASGDAVVAGKEVQFTATPNSGYRVKEWTINSAIVADNKTDTLTIESLGQDTTVTVEFELIPPVSGYIVAVSANPAEGGTVTGGGNYETGDRVKVNATANENFAFVHWTEGSTVVSKGETYTFKMGTENRELVAHFMATEPTDEWLVTVSARPSEGGTVEGGGTYGEGDWVEVTATPNTGYRFINWTEGLNEVSTELVYGFEMGTFPRSLTANFLAEGSGWPKGVRLSATNITATSVTLVLSGPVPEAIIYRVYSDSGSYLDFLASEGTTLLLDGLNPMTFYTFTVQAVFSGDVETSDGPSIKVKTKK